MAMRAATGVLRTRRVVASAAVTSCRSLSAFSAEELKTLEDRMESRLGVKMERHFETRVRQIVRSEVTKDIVASEVAKINKELNIPALMKNAEAKRELHFKAKLAEHKLWVTMKINAADRTMTKMSSDVMNRANTYSKVCAKRDHSTELKSEIFEGRQQFLKESLAARRLDARVSLIKAIGYVISVPSALYGAATRFYFGRGGGN